MIQIDMEMPDSCRKCCFLIYDMYTGETSCVIEDMILARYFEALDFEGRHEECPLIDVPDINAGNSSEILNGDDVFVTVDEAIDLIEKACGVWEDEYGTSDDDWSDLHKACDMAVEALKQLEIIRCKECKYHSHDAGYGHDWCNRTTGVFRVNEDDFCSYAERKTDG